MAPSIVTDLVDRLVISKPPGWEVHDDGMPKQLRTWLKSLGRWPILSDPDSDFGFLHRLDVPSSGLLLVAKTYEGYYDLQLQLRSGTLARHYVVLNHGCMKRSRIDARQAQQDFGGDWLQMVERCWTMLNDVKCSCWQHTNQKRKSYSEIRNYGNPSTKFILNYEMYRNVSFAFRSFGRLHDSAENAQLS